MRRLGLPPYIPPWYPLLRIPVNVTRATLNALRSLHSVEELSRRRGVPLRLVVPGQPAAAQEVADAR